MGALVLRRAARTAMRSGVLWGVLLGIVVASAAATYQSLYKTASQRQALAAAFGSNSATSALFGPAPGLDTVAGFTAFKSLLTVMVLAAVWGLLVGTRLLRGEEEAGRWELLLLGGTGQRRAVGEVLAALAAGVVLMWALCTALLAFAGQRPGVEIAASSAAYFALAALSPAAMFAAVGALTSQLAPTRRQAAAYAAWFLGASYALRLVADAAIGLHALVWLSPLGWVEELRPLTGTRPFALVPIAVFTAVVGALAVQLAGSRDVGSGLVPDRSHRTAHTRSLANPTTLAARLNRPAVVGWWAALTITGLLLGLVARAAGNSMGGSSVATVFTRLGVPGADARSFLGVAFLVVAVLIAFLAAGQVVATAREEEDGRLEHLLAGPVSRASWLCGRAAVALAAVIGGALLAGLAAWLGGLSEGDAVALPALIGAGLNAVPPAVFLLGAGFLMLGAWPSATSVAVYGLLGWSLLVEVAGGLGSGSRLLLDTSLFHQISAAPAAQPDWTVGGVLVAIGVAAAAVGTLALRQRDLRVP
jgi:ABC-2 type transport system permease protein